MRISARKSGEIIIGMSELEAVALQEIFAAVTTASEENPKFFTPYRTFAINKNSKMAPEAWKFIKTLLSDEIQSSSDMYYFPVNNNALKAKAAEEIARNYIYKSNEMQKSGRKIKPLTQEGVNFVNKMIGELKAVPYFEPQAGKIVSDVAEEYFSGKKSAEEAAKMIQSKISIYLGE
jgi:multiple sugar transport system substrate-binding protein